MWAREAQLLGRAHLKWLWKDLDGERDHAVIARAETGEMEQECGLLEGQTEVRDARQVEGVENSGCRGNLDGGGVWVAVVRRQRGLIRK